MSCSVGYIHGLHLALLWHRPTAAALIHPLHQELPHAHMQPLKTKTINTMPSKQFKTKKLKLKIYIYMKNIFLLILGRGGRKHLLISHCSLSIFDCPKSNLTNIKYWKLCKHATQIEILTTIHLESSFKTKPAFRKNPPHFKFAQMFKLSVQLRRVNKMYQKVFY